jgi:glyoxylase-like metal-dependent hydrolase (beta-lactamase superfamily II)
MGIAEVQPRIYRISSTLGPRRFAQWLVVGDDRMLLVDSGIHGTVTERIVPALSALGRQPEEITDVVISHADVDHYGGNAELRRLAPRACIRASAHDRRWLESWTVISRERYGWYRRHGLDYDASTWAWLKSSAGPDTPLDGTIAGDATLELGGIAVEAIALPGHSPGHLGIVHRESGTAIVMDAVLGRGLYTVDDELISPPPYGCVTAYRNTIERLQRIQPTRLGTSHYAPVEGPIAVNDFLTQSAGFVDDLDVCVRNVLSPESKPLECFWRAAAARMGPFPEMAVELARSVGAHLDLAVQDGAAVRLDINGLPAWRVV